jgi:hypothetical protein
MVLHCLITDGKKLGDLFVAPTVCDVFQDLYFATGERTPTGCATR